MRVTLKKSCWGAVVASIIWFVFTSVPIVYAQSSLGTVLGTVRDSSGALVPQANVTVTNVDTGQKRFALTDEAGNYTATALESGRYRVASERPGFAVGQSTEFTLHVAQIQRVDFILHPGLTTQVTVTGEVAAVQTDSPTRSTVISGQETVDIPLNGRNFQQLLQLAPGTTTANSVNGARSEQSTFNLDGASFTENDHHQPSAAPSIDAIQEFNFAESMASAKYGQGGAGVTDIKLKSGTNNWHGTLFDFLRNDALDARNYFSQSAPPSLRQNQFGFVLTGPIIHNKTFFMFNYEGLRQHAASVHLTRVPTTAERNGDFSADGPIYNPFAPLNPDGTRQQFDGNQIPENLFSPFYQALEQYWPQPNYAGSAVNYVNSTPGQSTNNQYNGRFDQNFSPANMLSISLLTSFQSAFHPGSIPVANDWLAKSEAWVPTIRYTHIFSPTMLSVTLVSFNRLTSNQVSGTTNSIASSVGVPVEKGVDGFPFVKVSGMAGMATDKTGLPYVLSTNNWQYAEDVTKVWGSHTVGIGVAIKTINFNEQISAAGEGRASFSGQFTSEHPGSTYPYGWADFILGAPYQLQMDVGDWTFPTRRKTADWYIQDDWKVDKNLTLNLGLRHELNFPWTVPNRTSSLFDPNCGCIEYMQGAPLPPNWNPPYPIRTDGPTSFGGTHVRNFAPRFGLAWSPFGQEHGFVVRGGYGIFFDSPVGDAMGILGFAPPFRGSLIANSKTFQPSLQIPSDYPTPTNTPPGSGPAPFGIDPHAFPDPYMQQWNLTMERALPWKINVSAGYVGTKGTHLMINRWPNVAVPGPGTPQLPYPGFSPSVQVFQTVANSNYNSLQLGATKPFSNGLLFQLAYTWGRSLDIGSTSTSDYYAQQNPRDIQADYGRSTFDVRHRFSAGFDYLLPVGRGQEFFSTDSRLADLALGGWHFSGIIVAQSGYPFSVQSPPTGLNNHGNFRRADIHGANNGALPSGQRTIRRWFNTDAFSTPPLYTYGNSGRNILDAPGILNIDLSVRKLFFVTHEQHVEFRAEAFNAPNHANFGAPSANTGSPQLMGLITSAAAARIIQVGLKYQF